MIKSDIIKIPFITDNREIETILHSKGIEPLRWAVVTVGAEFIEVSVSYHVQYQF